MTWNLVVAWAMLSYLLGSLSLGYTVASRRGIDLLTFGSGGTGKTNTERAIGPVWAMVSFIVDILKATLPVVAVRAITKDPSLSVGMGLIALFGHCKSIFVPGFKGGKGVACLLGIALGVEPVLATCVFVVWWLIKKKSKFVSLASLVAAAVFATAEAIFTRDPMLVKLSFIAAACYVAIRHKSNIERLRKGEERPVVEKEKRKVEDGAKTSAFLFHPLTPEDFRQTDITSWLADLIAWGFVPIWLAHLMLLVAPVMNVGAITGIEYELKDGTIIKGHVDLLVGPLLPAQLKYPAISKKEFRWWKPRHILSRLYENRKRVILQDAALMTEELGVETLTLGALFSTFGRGGSELKRWCEKQGLKVKIDNGGGNTDAATLKIFLEKCPVPMGEVKLAAVAARGAIVKAFVDTLHKMFPEIQITELAREKVGGQMVDIDMSRLADHNVIVFGSSSEMPLLHKDNVHYVDEDAVIFDIAVPEDVAREIEAVPEEVLRRGIPEEIAEAEKAIREVWRSGLMLLPGKNLKCPVNFHFGVIMTEHGPRYLVPACLVQGQILVITGEYDFVSCGLRINVEAVMFFFKMLVELGVIVIASPDSETTIFHNAVASPPAA